MNTLEFAINMEQDGVKYYREQAKLNQGTDLESVCNLLADEESRHAQILINKKDKNAYELKDYDLLSEAKNVFSNLQNIKVERDQHAQREFYAIAADMEQKSVELYEEFLREATLPEEKELFQFLIDQEKAHLELLDELVQLVLKNEEWVESAEFGLREEY